MKTIRLICNLLVIATLFAACQDSTSPVSGTDSDAAPMLTDFSAHILAPEAFTGGEISEEERAMIAQFSVEDQIMMTQLIQEAGSWMDAHNEMQKALRVSSRLPDYVREQRAAVFMLRAAGSLDELRDEEREGVAVYADLLAKHRSPEAALMVEALSLLDGYWTDDQIQVAAASSLEGANTFLENRYYCDDCPASKTNAGGSEAIQHAQDAFITEILGSITQLSVLAG